MKHHGHYTLMSPEELAENLEAGHDKGFIRRQLMKRIRKYRNDKRHIQKNKKAYYKTHLNLGDMAQGAPTNYKDKYGRIIKIGDTIFYNNLRWIANKFSKLECPAGKTESVHMSDISPLDMEIINHKTTKVMNVAPDINEILNNDEAEQSNVEQNQMSEITDGQILDEVNNRGLSQTILENVSENELVNEVLERGIQFMFPKDDIGIENLLDKIEDRFLVQELKKRGFSGKLTKEFQL